MSATGPAQSPRTPPYLGQLGLLAIAYALAALLASQLAFAPAFASPVWPAAGVAMAGLLIGGLRTWPGVALGYLAFYGWQHAQLFGSDAMATATTGAVLTAAVTLQALLGARLVRPMFDQLALGREVVVLRALLLGGPLACLVAPTVGVSLLSWRGIVAPDATLAAWLTWWVGDSIGVVLFAPIAMLVSPRLRALWRARLRYIAAPLLGAAVALVAATLWFNTQEEGAARSRLAQDASLAHDLMLQRQHAAVEAAIATGNFISNSAYLAPQEFAGFTASMRKPGLLSLQWLPRVRRNGATQADAASLSEFPVQFADPPQSHWNAARIDVAASAAASEAMVRARDTGLPSASAPIVLPADGAIGTLVFVPVYRVGSDAQQLSLVQRRSRFKGFVLAVLDPRPLAAVLFDGKSGQDIAFTLDDVTVADTPRLLMAGSQQARADAPLLWQRDLDFFGRDWRMRAVAANHYWHAGKSGPSQLFLLGSLAVMLLCTHYVLALAGRNRIVEREIARRTAQVRQGQQRLERAMELSQMVEWEYDLASGEFLLNDRYFRFLHTSAEREGGYRMAASEWAGAFLHPDDLGLVMQVIGAAGKPGFVLPDAVREIRLICRSGDVRHVYISIDLDPDAQGGLTRVNGTVQDFSERKRAEDALRRSEQYSRSIVESSIDCVKVLSLEGKVLDMNPRGRTLIGLHDSEQMRDIDWIVFWQREQDRQAMRQAIETARAGQMARLQGYTPTLDGTPKWWDVVVSPILGAKGEPARLLCVTRDITAERTATEEIVRINAGLEQEVQRRTAELSQSEALLRATFDGAPVAISHIASDGRLLRVNPRLCEITGRAADALIGSQEAELTDPRDRAEDQALASRLMQGELADYSIEKRYLRADGATVWVRVHGSIVRDDAGMVLYRVAIAQDISESRTAEQMRIDSERRYRELFEFNPMPMWTYDVETLAFTDVNTAAVDHYGYTRDEFLAMTIVDIRPAHELVRLRQNIAGRGLQNRNGGEFVHRKKDGDLITVEITSYGLDFSGRPGRLVLANDISERKRADGLLAAQRDVLEHIASGAPLSETLQAMTGIVESALPEKFCSILLLDRQTRTLCHGAAPSLPKAYAQAIEDAPIGPTAGSCGTAAFTGQEVVSSDIASDPLWADYRELALSHGLRSCWSLPIRDAEGGVAGTFALYGRQVGTPSAFERKLIETLGHTAQIAITKEREKVALRESEERFRAIYEKSPIGIVVVSGDGRILRANPRQCELTGYREDELVGVTIQDLTHPEDVQRDVDQFDSVWEGDRDTYSIEKRAVRRDGTEYWVSVSGAMVRDSEGTSQYGIRVIQDVTDRVHADKALRDSEQRFRSTFELAALGIAHVGPEGTYLRVNPSMARITGYDEAELLRMGPAQLVCADDMHLDDDLRRRLLAGQIPSYSIEKRCVHKNGSLVWTNATVSVVRDPQGALLYTFVILEDISRRKRIESDLEQQQELNRLLLENLAEGVVACDGDGKLILFNKATREWHGTDIMDTPPETWASHFSLFEGDGRTPLAQERIPLIRAFNGETVINVEMSIARPGMPARLVLASGAPLIDAEGIKRGAVVVMHDVTERQQHLRKLKCIDDVNEATRTLADPDAVVAVTTRRLGEYLEAAHCVYADVAPDEDQVDILRDFAPAGTGMAGRYRLSDIGPTVAQTLRDGELVALDDMRAQWPAAEGPVLQDAGMRSALIVPLRKGDRLRAIMVVGDDVPRQWTEHEKDLMQTVTERCWVSVERERAQRALENAAEELKAANAAVEHERSSLARRVAERTEELTVTNASLARAVDAAEAASRAKSAFLATISHEIRTPMNGVLGAMELLGRTGLDGERRALLGTAQESARSLLGLLNDLLDMAKIEAGRIEIAPAPASLEAIVGQVVSTHMPNAITKGIDLHAEVDPVAPAWVHIDGLRVRQILGNLVSNAVKFTSEGGVSLSVHRCAADDDGCRIRFVVHDSGVGIPPAALQTLFQPFEQGTAELARQSGGTGLGLAISRGLAEHMGGAVWLESSPGHGTTATLELPLQVAEAAQAEGQDEDDDTIISRFHAWQADDDGAAQVLVVDDHPVNRRLLRRQLEQLGLRADVACDGVEALELLRSGDYRLVITDCEMPRLDGFGLARAIRERADGAWADLPIVACTAHALPEVEQRCRECGMNDVLTKPIALASLARVLRGLWPKSAVLQQAEAGEPTAAPMVDVLLDDTHVAEITGGDKGLERELLDEFMADARVNLGVLQRAVAQADHAGCKAMAHRGLGAARIVGATAMARALGDLQRLAAAQASQTELQLALSRLQHAQAAMAQMLNARSDAAGGSPTRISTEVAP